MNIKKITLRYTLPFLLTSGLLTGCSNSTSIDDNTSIPIVEKAPKKDLAYWKAVEKEAVKEVEDVLYPSHK